MTFCYRKDPKNIGDQMSCPGLYFDLGRPRYWLDVAETDRAQLANNHVIFGGGGMLFPDPGICGVLEYVCNNRTSKRIICWGIGSNTHGSSLLEYPAFLNKADLVGIRDLGSPYLHVPCVSCMSKEFDCTMEAQHEYAIFEHREFPLPESLEGPRMSNEAGRERFLKIIKHLSSGSCVITNSYHGAYWGLLLGRRVVVVEPFSSKFYGLPPEVVIARRDNWHEIAANAPTISADYLGHCREQNIGFFADVQTLLGDS